MPSHLGVETPGDSSTPPVSDTRKNRSQAMFRQEPKTVRCEGSWKYVQISSELETTKASTAHTSPYRDRAGPPPQPVDNRRIQREVRINTSNQQNTYHYRCRRRARQLQVGKRAGHSRLLDPSTTFMQEKRPKAPGTDDAYVSTVEKGIAHEERTHHELQLWNLHGLLSHSGYLSLFTTRKTTTLSMNRIRSTSHRQRGLLELVAACSQRQKPCRCEQRAHQRASQGLHH